MPWWGHWHLRRGGALDAGCCLAQGSLLMSRAGLPPPGTHSKARACPSSQDDSERGHLCWMNLKGTVDATCFSPLSSKSEQCLAFRKLPPHCGNLLLCFSFLRGLFFFTFFVLHSCTAWYLHQCISPITAPIQTDTGALTLHRPCTNPAPGIVLNAPTYLVAELQTSEMSLYWSHFTDEKAEAYRGI